MSALARCLLLTCLLSGTVQAQTAAPEWKLIKKVGDVEVYSRKVPGESTAALKGSAVIEASVARIMQVLLDCQRATTWVDSLAESRVVRVTSPTSYVEYNRVAMPLIVNDREFLTQVTIAVDAEAKRVVIRSASTEDNSVRRRRKYVRGTLSGNYELQALGDGRTRVTIEMSSDPKGWLPGWLVDFFQKDWPRLTIEGIRQQAAQAHPPPEEFKALLADVGF